MHHLQKLNKTSQLLCFLLLFIFSSLTLSAQSVSNFGSWNILGVKASLADKWTLTYTHNFLRMEDYYKEHDRVFSDLSLNYKLRPNISLNLLQRYVTISGDDNDAYWIFADVNYIWKQKGGAFSVKGRARAHIGTEWVGEIAQSDFLRTALIFNLTLHPKLTPFISLEPFYQFNGVNELNRIRYELGTKWKVFPRLNLTANYRIDAFGNRDPKLQAHVIVLGIVYQVRK